MPIKLKSIRPNPENPRLIKDQKFWLLLRSVFEFPKGLSVRPVVVDADGIIIGGNMRYKCFEHIVENGVQQTIQQIISKTKNENDPEDWEETLANVGAEVWEKVVKSKSVPDNWVGNLKDFSPEERERFMVIDNVGFGEWDWNTLANEAFAFYDKWASWGFEVPKWMQGQDDVNLDDFFEDSAAQAEGEEKKQKIILQYTEDEHIMVKEALAKIAKTPEQAVWQLLGLEENTEEIKNEPPL